jgi:hypothetical protein
VVLKSLYRKRPGGWSWVKTGIAGRFRDSHLKEAARVCGRRGEMALLELQNSSQAAGNINTTAPWFQWINRPEGEYADLLAGDAPEGPRRPCILQWYPGECKKLSIAHTAALPPVFKRIGNQYHAPVGITPKFGGHMRGSRACIRFFVQSLWINFGLAL